MLGLRELWQRMRSGVPGAPSRAGVPVDRLAELDAELGPVFAALAEPQREAQALIAAAQAEAGRRRSAAAGRAASIVAEARADAGGAQSRAAAARLARAEADRSATLETARAEAARIDRVAAERLPAAIEALVTELLEPRR